MKGEWFHFGFVKRDYCTDFRPTLHRYRQAPSFWATRQRPFPRIASLAVHICMPNIAPLWLDPEAFT